MEREYTVIANTREDLPALEAEITASSGAGPIPNRSVDVANPRLGSKIQTHFMLTDEEAEALRSDPRVRAIEIPPEQRDDISIGLHASQPGVFYRGFNDNTDTNWGLRRVTKAVNEWQSANAEASDRVYEYAIDGAGVDVVISDSGIDPDHPEWLSLRDELIEDLSGTNDFITNSITDIPNSRVVHELDSQYQLTGTNWYDLADTTVRTDPEGTWQHDKEFRIEFFEANGTKITEVTRTYKHDISNGTGLTATQFSKNYSGTIYIGESDSFLLQGSLNGKSGTVKISFAQGQSRMHQIDWYSVSGLSGAQDADHYRDADGHGTHVAGTAAGKTHGWAKGAHVYAVKVSGLETLSGSDGTGISTTDCFDVIRNWHNNKANGRPTVVNMSWGYGGNRSGNPTSGVHKGTAWTWGVNYNDDNALWAGTGIFPSSSGTRRLPVQVVSIDAEVEDMIDDGIHVCIAAGNDYYKSDVSTGDDYNNTVSYGGAIDTYHRPSSPYDPRAFCVGNISTSVVSETDLSDTNIFRDGLAASSKRGPAVNIWAPGTNIMAATSTQRSTVYNSASVTYPENDAYEIMSISGTSMASPQVCGVVAQHLQVFPNATPAQMLSRITNESKPTCYDIAGDVDLVALVAAILEIAVSTFDGDLYGFLSQTDDLGYLYCDVNLTGGPISNINSQDAQSLEAYRVGGTSGDATIDTWIEGTLLPAARTARFEYPTCLPDTTDYDNSQALLGSPNRMLYSKYGRQTLTTNSTSIITSLRSN